MIEPGIYDDLSNEAYHGDQDYLSSSRLKGYLPEHFKKPSGSTDALDFGTLFHTVVLEPENLRDYAIIDAHAIAGDNPKTGRPYDSPQMTAKYKAHVATLEGLGQTVVTQEQHDLALRMRDAIQRHDTARRLLEATVAREESAFWVDDTVEGNVVRHKARFDGRGPGFILDLKSTSAKPGRYSLRRACRDYGYHVSAAHYMTVARGVGLDADSFALIFVSKDEPNYVTVAEIGPELLAEGHDLRNEAIRRHTDPSCDAYEGARGYITL